jgi:hypothetical protein
VHRISLAGGAAAPVADWSHAGMPSRPGNSYHTTQYELCGFVVRYNWIKIQISQNFNAANSKKWLIMLFAAPSITRMTVACHPEHAFCAKGLGLAGTRLVLSKVEGFFAALRMTL